MEKKTPWFYVQATNSWIMESSYSIFLRVFGSRPSKRLLRKLWSQGGIVELPARIKSLLRERKGGMESRVRSQHINNGIMGCSQEAIWGWRTFINQEKGNSQEENGIMGGWRWVGKDLGISPDGETSTGMDGMTNRTQECALGMSPGCVRNLGGI